MNQKALSKSKKLEMLDIGESLDVFLHAWIFFVNFTINSLLIYVKETINVYQWNLIQCR